jgi:hypothetical protein
MSIAKRIGPRVVEWNPQPGRGLPLPRLADDRETFPDGVVKAVLQWLESVRLAFHRKGPTDQLIQIENGIPKEGSVSTKIRVVFQSGIQTVELNSEFSAGTFEIVLRDKRGAPVDVAYQYLGARCADGRCIVGPLLEVAPKRTIQVVTSAVN